ncbi:hypothetical protein [Streptomyces rimosus]|uniref:hypothetical protein n=1 Tax=Streptomyces rimosus TaxID=1927 RepID=UPI0018FE6F57|nr:hypothetical protein [Streptomyces rimosus]
MRTPLAGPAALLTAVAPDAPLRILTSAGFHAEAADDDMRPTAVRVRGFAPGEDRGALS